MLNRDAVDAITMAYNLKSRLVDLQGTPASFELRAVLENMYPSYMNHASGAVLERTSASANDFGFRYPREELLDPGEEMWTGVEVHAIDEVAYVSEPDFDRVMLRLFHIFIEAAPAANHPVVGTPRWFELLANVAAIEAQGRGR